MVTRTFSSLCLYKLFSDGSGRWGRRSSFCSGSVSLLSSWWFQMLKAGGKDANRVGIRPTLARWPDIQSKWVQMIMFLRWYVSAWKLECQCVHSLFSASVLPPVAGKKKSVIAGRKKVWFVGTRPEFGKRQLQTHGGIKSTAAVC